MKKIRILVILSVAVLIFGGLVTQGILASGDQPEGKPFQALWDAIDNLHGRIDAHGVPVGAIMMWSGAIAPDNWHICDGTGGTPDLRDRFIVGSGSSYGIGDKGGAAMVKLDISQMPSHSHHYSGTTSTAGDHKHSYRDKYVVDRYDITPAGWKKCPHDHWTDELRTTHSAGDHNHTYSGDTDYQGGDAAHENRPPYYALAYIMKVQ